MPAMRAAVVRSFTDPLVVEELDVPSPGPHEALVKVDYTGVCHTDLHAAHGDWPVKPAPRSCRATRASARSSRSATR